MNHIHAGLTSTSVVTMQLPITKEKFCFDYNHLYKLLIVNHRTLLSRDDTSFSL